MAIITSTDLVRHRIDKLIQNRHKKPRTLEVINAEIAQIRRDMAILQIEREEIEQELEALEKQYPDLKKDE